MNSYEVITFNYLFHLLIYFELFLYFKVNWLLLFILHMLYELSYIWHTRLYKSNTMWFYKGDYHILDDPYF
jgi:hypothetical protein